MRRILIPAFSTLLATSVVAQDRPNTILVMDGSGSMWGQIDGVAKITIAQDVVRDLLTSLPDSDRLGLTVYGHRARGDCTDIENVVAPGPATRDAIAAAVDEIQPLGKTPMTDAVIAAANTLRYTEDSATVILVSDGVETCNPDPCAAARLLEQAGIDFTAHVIGFDVSGDAEALAQMQCIAEETGGMFIPAANAGELSEALNTIVEEPEMVVVAGTFSAVLGDESGPLIQEPIMWDITSDAGDIVDDEFGNPLSAELLEGTYRATAYRLIDEVQREATFTVTGSGDITINIPFPDVIPNASVTGPATAILGDTIDVTWAGPNGSGDYIAVSSPDETGYDNYSYTSEGSPLQLEMPPMEGTYELRYFADNGNILARSPITISPAPVTMQAPPEAQVGEQINVIWSGPDYQADFIAVGTPGESGYINYTYTSEGSPLELEMPTDAGQYELRYTLRQDNTVIYTQPISVVPLAVTLIAPDTAAVGERIIVGWDGPDYESDFLSVGIPGESGYINYTYTREGNPLELEMPTEPGTYEIRYQLRQDNEIMATRTIEVMAVQSQITAPDTAPAGSGVTVGWVGPDYDADFIAVGPIGESSYINYTYTSDGNPLTLQMPVEPGDYEIRYTLRQDNEVIATKVITIEETTAQLIAPATAIAGETLTIGWEGPDYAQDFLAVGPVGESKYINYTYTSDGNPLTLEMPAKPGDYEIRYTLRQDNEVIVTSPITIAPVKAELTTPDTAIAGETLTIPWTGPDYPQDFLAVGPVGESRYINYTYTNDGTPLGLEMPAVPGDYEIRYTMRQDNTVIVARPITVAPTKAQLTAPATIKLGEELIVTWTGPDYPQDFIGISEIDDPRGYESYTYTRDGSPLSVRMPDEAGEYEIRYFMRQDNTIVARIPLTITE